MARRGSGSAELAPVPELGAQPTSSSGDLEARCIFDAGRESVAGLNTRSTSSLESIHLPGTPMEVRRSSAATARSRGDPSSSDYVRRQSTSRRRSQSSQSSRRRRSSFSSTGNLINNQIAIVMGTMRRCSTISTRFDSPYDPEPSIDDDSSCIYEANSWVRQCSKADVDWSCEHNLQHLRNIRRLVRKYFRQFVREAQAEATKGRHSSTVGIGNSEATTGLSSRSTLASSTGFNSEAFSNPVQERPAPSRRGTLVGVLQVLLTTYAVFGPDALLMHGQSSRHNLAIAVFNTFVLAIFVLEIVVKFRARGYRWSIQFWVDVVATLSMVGETVVAYALMPRGDASSHGGAPAFMSPLSLNLRSSRLVRLARTMRIVQMLRVFPTVTSIVSRRSNKVAHYLARKRMGILLQLVGEMELDRRTDGTDVAFLTTAIDMEFPTPKPGVWMRLRRKLQQLFPTCCAHFDFSRHHMTSVVEDAAGAHQAELVNDFYSTPRGVNLINACIEDVRSVQNSQWFMDSTIQQVILKVCLTVVVLLVLLPLVEFSYADEGDFQVLEQLDSAVHGDPSGGRDVCPLIRRGAGAFEMRLLYLSSGAETWTDTCECCRSSWPEAADVRDRAQAIMDGSGLQAHELMRLCLPDLACAGAPPRTLAVFDRHRSVRSNASWSLLYSLMGVLIMMAAVLMFTYEMRKVQEWLLDPIWATLDEIMQLKSMDHLRMAGEAYAPPAGASIELTAINGSMQKLRGAIRSWAKYVPMKLTGKLYHASVEARLGVHYCDVTVFFCDFDGLDELVRSTDIHSFVRLRTELYNVVAAALDAHQGTLLEFIDNEILAVFNAPDRVEDHAMQALNAALQVQEGVQKVRDAGDRDEEPEGSADASCASPRLPGLSSVRLRMGVMVTNVLIGNVGAPTRMKYGMLGDGVNTTARLKSLNGQYGTSCLTTKDTLSAAGPSNFVARPIGNLVLKGKNVPTKTWEVMGTPGRAPPALENAAQCHKHGFHLFQLGQFSEARVEFERAGSQLKGSGGARGPAADGPSSHLARLCDGYLGSPPPPDWDGSEWLKRK